MIGILDSGVGGLSVVNEINRRLPRHGIVYVGDSAWCPYGSKSYEDLRARCRTICDFLVNEGAEVIVIACNSATIAAVELLRTEYPLPFIGMEPGVKPAAQISRSGVIGILATEASLQGEKFHRLVSTHAREVRVITRPCPKFVALVEDGCLECREVEEAIDEYTAPMLDAGADVLILGCTHYPFLANAIRARVPTDVQIIDTGEAVARRVESLVGPPDDGAIEIHTTGSREHLEDLLPRLCPDLEASCHQLAF